MERLELVPFYTIFAPLIGKELAELVEDGMKYSLPVPVMRAGRQFDALFLYRPDDETIKRPSGWLMLDSHSGKLAVLAECEVMDFAAPDLLAPPVSAENHVKELTPKREAQLRAKLGDLYDEIRGFVFTERLDRTQAAQVSAYKEAFLKFVRPWQYPFYYALSPHYFQWLRLPFPTHSAELQAEDKPVLEEPTQLLILQNLQHLVYRFESKIQVDEQKNSVFDEMHAELQRYKKGMLEQLTQTLELDVIKLFDDTFKSVEVFSQKPASPDNYDKLFVLLQGLVTDIEDLLYRHGIEPYEHGGDNVDVLKQKIISTVITDDPGLNRKLAKRMSRGWEKQGRIISPERISVYLFQDGQEGE